MPESVTLACERCDRELKERFTQVQLTVRHGSVLDMKPKTDTSKNLCEDCVKLVVPKIEELLERKRA